MKLSPCGISVVCGLYIFYMKMHTTEYSCTNNQRSFRSVPPQAKLDAWGFLLSLAVEFIYKLTTNLYFPEGAASKGRSYFLGRNR